MRGYDTLQTFLFALTWQVGVHDAVEAGWQLVATMLSGQKVRICPPLELDTKSDERCGVPDTGGGGHNDTETCHVANEREIGFQNALESQRWNALFGISEMAVVVKERALWLMFGVNSLLTGWNLCEGI